ncbi:dTDP-4-dehydrorhamnose 3,5-epimerase family protein [Candidatus Margulisiibacteriota bacterium]
MQTNIEGVKLTPLKIIPNELGDILHAMKKDDEGYAGFGEAYFSTVKNGVIKGWKKHYHMTLNLVVPIGLVKFVAYDPRPESPTKGIVFEEDLSPENYKRLTIPPGVWLSFQGQGPDLNMLLNLASIKHDPTEADNLPVGTEEIPYMWRNDPWKDLL